MALEEDLLGLMPVAHLLGALEVGGEAAVEVLEDAVLVAKATIGTARGSAVLDGSERTALLLRRGGRDSVCEGLGRRLGGRSSAGQHVGIDSCLCSAETEGGGMPVGRGRGGWRVEKREKKSSRGSFVPGDDHDEGG